MLTSSSLDRYIAAQSPIHALDGRVKLLLTLAYVLALTLLPPGAWLSLMACALMVWWAVFRSRVGLRVIIGRAFVALPFALVAVTLIFARPGEPLLSFALGQLRLTATLEGIVAFVSVVLKSWLSVQAALLLTATTSFSDLLYALRALRLPTPLVSILSFAYRYLFVVVDEARRMLRARECRSAELPGRPGGGSVIWRATVVGRMVGTLFLRAYERSERIYVAMLARGYDGEPRALAVRPLSSTEQGLLLIGAALLAAIVYLAHLVP